VQEKETWVENRVEPAEGGMRERRYRGRYLLAALAIAMVVGLGAAVPVFAQDEDGSIHPQVVGGDPVPNGKYPFMTSIQADTSKRGGYQEHYCGGTLIDPNSVLTAAHCVEFIGRNTNGNTLGYRDVRLVVGVTVLSSDQGQARRIDRFSDIDIHPNFSRRTLRHDAAVIKLGRPVKRIDPISLADVGSDDLETPGNLATVTGWGYTEPSPGPPPRYPKRMREGKPPLVSDTQCETSYREEFYPALMVCAGQGGIDTCQGDSGGPMFVEDSAGVRRQIGITSWGFECAVAGSPGVYAEVNAQPIHDFIVRAMTR
jgi:secreted trypsin-like serine protease